MSRAIVGFPAFAHPLNAVRALLNWNKGEGSPNSITESRVPELIPVLGSQPAGDVSHKPGLPGATRVTATTFRPACSYPRNP